MNKALKPIKRLGQNFLIDPNIIKKIFNSARVSKKDIVLEIGAGHGALTFLLAKKAGKVVAVEVDRGLLQELAEKAKDRKNLIIVGEDILKFDLKRFAKKKRIKSFKVIANLPYYITAPIIERLFKSRDLVSDIFITVQKEVAQRMTAAAGQEAYGSFSCFVNYFTSPKILFLIKKGSFWPVPKVESAFVRLKPFKDPRARLGLRSESLFFQIVRASFGQRRKTLLSSLSKIVSKDFLSRLGCKDVMSRRPEELNLSDFALLSNLIFDNSKVG
jgi:16S rRNA (adenine1518-N6/adenine1519-N6)-dimethyltransferase